MQIGIGLGTGFGALPLPDVPPPARTLVYLLGGQSNLRGQATFDGGAEYPAGVLEVARAGKISGGADGALVQAVHQLDHHDPAAGHFGPALQFALDHVAAQPGDTLVLVPCCRGGTGFADSRWNPGDDLYADAVARLNAVFAAHPDYELGGFLMEFGEADAKLNSTTILRDIGEMVAALRGDVSAAGPATPLVLTGPLAAFATAWPGSNVAEVRRDLTRVPDQIAHTAMIGTDDLGDLGDNVHYDAASVRLAGSRLFAALPAARANAPKAPPTPYEISAVPGDGAIAVEVPALFNAESYSYEYRPSSGGGWTVFASSASPSATLTGLANGTAYDLRVSAQNALGTSGTVTATGVTPAAGAAAEAGAVGHWLLGSDNPGHAGLAGGALSPNGAVPVLHAGYAAISGADELDGLASALPETAALTLCYVIRKPDSARSILGGTLRKASLGPGGFGLVCAAGAALKVMQNASASSIESLQIQAGWPVGQFFFLAAAIDAAGGVTGYVGDAAAPVTVTGSFAGRQADAAGLLGIGNTSYDDGLGTFANPYDIAEAIVFDSALDAGQIAAVYARSVARLAARGIAVA